MQQSLLQDLRQTSRLGRAIAPVAATIGVIYGYDLSNIAGALLFITDEFHLSIHQQERVTTAVVVGQVIGAIVAGWLANRFGRKRCMVLLAVSYAVFAVLGALSVSVPMLLLARLFLGLTWECRLWSCRCSWPSLLPQRFGERCWSPTKRPPSSESSWAIWPLTLLLTHITGAGCWGWPLCQLCLCWPW